MDYSNTMYREWAGNDWNWYGTVREDTKKPHGVVRRIKPNGKIVE